jgi:hypothetical protein
MLSSVPSHNCTTAQWTNACVAHFVVIHKASEAAVRIGSKHAMDFVIQTASNSQQNLTQHLCSLPLLWSYNYTGRIQLSHWAAEYSCTVVFGTPVQE